MGRGGSGGRSQLAVVLSGPADPAFDALLAAVHAARREARTAGGLPLRTAPPAIALRQLVEDVIALGGDPAVDRFLRLSLLDTGGLDASDITDAELTEMVAGRSGASGQMGVLRERLGRLQEATLACQSLFDTLSHQSGATLPSALRERARRALDRRRARAVTRPSVKPAELIDAFSLVDLLAAQLPELAAVPSSLELGALPLFLPRGPACVLHARMREMCVYRGSDHAYLGYAPVEARTLSDARRLLRSKHVFELGDTERSIAGKDIRTRPGRARVFVASSGRPRVVALSEIRVPRSALAQVVAAHSRPAP